MPIVPIELEYLVVLTPNKVNADGSPTPGLRIMRYIVKPPESEVNPYAPIGSAILPRIPITAKLALPFSPVGETFSPLPSLPP